jgi:hypothetical protein
MSIRDSSNEYIPSKNPDPRFHNLSEMTVYAYMSNLMLLQKGCDRDFSIGQS